MYDSLREIDPPADSQLALYRSVLAWVLSQDLDESVLSEIRDRLRGDALLIDYTGPVSSAQPLKAEGPLRDYFAGLAMQALTDWGTVAPKRVAQRAFEIADAMVCARDAGLP